MAAAFNAVVEPNGIIRITATQPGNQAPTEASVTGATATLVRGLVSDGGLEQNTQDTFIVNFKQGNDPEERSFEFNNDLTLDQTAAAIASFSNTDLILSDTDDGVLMEVLTAAQAVDFPPSPNQVALAGTSRRIKYTYRGVAGPDIDTEDGGSINAARVTTGDTNGTFAIVENASSSVTHVTQGVTENTIGTLDTYTVVIDGVTVADGINLASDAKPLGGLDANEQAIEIARFLNAQP